MKIIAREVEPIRPTSGKFVDPEVTADGTPRAHVTPRALETLWFNTGTLCNLTCENCYIESSPTNDRLVYLSRAEVADYLAETATLDAPLREIGLTGGEPFMNPEIIGILHDCLVTGVDVLVLTNAMRPMMKLADELLSLREAFGTRLKIRVSIDHFERTLHESERGRRSWQPMVDGVDWLCANGFSVHIAGRTRWGDDEAALREGFRAFFNERGWPIDAQDPDALVIFPEMDPSRDVPEITTACWGILDVDPDTMMCASARMVVKRRERGTPEVVACTLLPYEPAFSLGTTLAESLKPVALNHPNCAKFCVLGGGSCS